MQKKKSGVGSVLRSKKGNIYIKVERDVLLKEGDTLMLETPGEKFKSLADNGIIDEDFAQSKAGRYAEGGDLNFVRYFIKDPIPQTNGNG